MAKITEMALAEIVIEWLQEQHWEVYQEVQLLALGSVADIVAVQNKRVWVIETKVTTSLQVMDQAWQWNRYAHYASIGVPSTYSHRPKLLNTVLNTLEIGMLSVDTRMATVREVVPPTLHRRISQQLFNVLREEHKTFAKAGNPDGNRYSAFKGTCIELVRAVNKNPGQGIGDLVAVIPHHYTTSATAKSALLNWIKWGKIPGIRLEKVGKRIYLYPEEIKDRG